MKHLNNVFLMAAAIACGLCAVSCGSESESEYEYSVRALESYPYSMDRLLAVDSLQVDIVSAMGLSADLTTCSVLLSGSDVTKCDEQAITAFRQACQTLDANDYGGKYQFGLLRGTADEILMLDSALFVAEAENRPGLIGDGGTWMDFESSGGPLYVYDLAVASHPNSLGQAMIMLMNNGYAICTGDLNYGAKKLPYIVLGCKYANADAVTSIMGEVESEEGELEERCLTAREAAISNLIMSYGSNAEGPIMGPKLAQKDLRKAEFIRVKGIGGYSTGDLNQGTSAPIYLWYTTYKNDFAVVSGLGWDHFTLLRKKDAAMVPAVKVNNDGTTELAVENGDTNNGNNKCNYKRSYLFFEVRVED